MRACGIATVAGGAWLAASLVCSSPDPNGAPASTASQCEHEAVRPSPPPLTTLRTRDAEVAIYGIDDASPTPDVMVFQAGTRQKGADIVTAGGRVLGVTALGSTLHAARDNAYRAVQRIRFQGAQYRSDIGRQDAEASTRR